MQQVMNRFSWKDCVIYMIRIDGLKKRFGKKCVLDDITLTLNDQNAWLLGPNGAGKTTLFRIILGLLPSNAGTVTADGKEGKRPNIGYLPQRFGPFPHLTVEEQMQYFAKLKAEKGDGIDWNAEAARTIQLVHLEAERRKKCGALSGGMVRRLGIAQAIMGKPDLILLDEPTVGLDIEERLRLQDILDSLQGEYPLLVSTHILDDIQNPCDEIIIFCNQKVAFQGSQKELKHMAEGLVWMVPEELYRLYAAQLIQISHTEENGTRYVRVLDRSGDFSSPDAHAATATVQDGYLSILAGEKGCHVPRT